MSATLNRTRDFPRRGTHGEPRQSAGPVRCESGGPVGYLRFWGVDYPYLPPAGSERRELPVPVDSEAQRLVRLTRREAGRLPENC